MSADLDKAIDRAVRELLDVEPRAGIRDRVLATLEHAAVTPERRSREGGRRWLWIAVPIAAAAVVLLAVTLRPAPPKPVNVPSQVASVDRRPIVRVAPPASARPAGGPPAAATAGGTRAAESAAARPRHRIAEPALPEAPEVVDALRVGIAPLSAPAPIVVQPYEPKPIEHADVTIEPMPALAPIVIEPLPADGRRN